MECILFYSPQDGSEMVRSFVFKGVLLSAALVAPLSLHISFYSAPMCLVPLWFVLCACCLSTLGDAQHWSGKHHTLEHKCEHMQSVCATNTQHCPEGICPESIP